jgi:hypothetical protein
MAGTVAVTTDPEKQAEHLRQQMRQIRREMGEDVEELVVQAERLMDWRYYVQQYPWVMVGAAAAAGFFLVPRRTVTLPTDEQTLSRLAQRIPVMMPKPPEAKKPTLFGSLLQMGTNLAMRAAMAYASQQAGKILGQQAAHQPSASHHAEAHHHG